MAYEAKLKVKINLGRDGVMFLPDKLKQDLDILIDDMMHSEMDVVIVLDGKEGTGKSFSSRIIARYCAYRTKTRFNADNIHLTTEDYINASEGSGRFHINILDESREAVGKRRSMAHSNVRYTNWLSENRDKQQIHIIILPAVHDLDSYISIWRMSLLIHHLKFHIPAKSIGGYQLVRGYFRAYENSQDLQRVIHNKARFGNYAYPKSYKYQRKISTSEVFTESELKKYNDKKAAKRKEKYKEVKKVSESQLIKEKERYKTQKDRWKEKDKMLKKRLKKLIKLSQDKGATLGDVASKWDISVGAVKEYVRIKDGGGGD